MRDNLSLETKAMKKCGYCGRENPNQPDHCSECGITLPEPAVENPKSKPENRALFEWLGTTLFYAGTFIVFALLYLLSFGQWIAIAEKS
jgi:hypothetical protein